MGTILQSFNIPWHMRPEVMKGDIGEEAVVNLLNAHGFCCYKSISPFAHPIDFLAIKNDMTKMLFCEVKTKPSRKFYPDTGFNYRNYKKYKGMEDRFQCHVFVAFVDDLRGQIYGDFLRKMEKPYIMNYKNKILKYPLVKDSIIYFPLAHMRLVSAIPADVLKKLSKFTSNNKSYSQGVM